MLASQAPGRGDGALGQLAAVTLADEQPAAGAGPELPQVPVQECGQFWWARRAGMPTAIVSNNSEGAITAYLTAHGLRSHVHAVIGRPHAHPARMKPDPALIRQAAAASTTDVGRCVLVGDSLSDIEGAHAAGARVIGYANRP
ncbi:HAD-IA family hydrolase [Dactylosporangium sp. NPDC049742]|uniref:HAD family hydrolase n=1 Tax=Dactylosporangium sp. NPDC049742 TaxID=3154737 RepID=UPI0034426FF4